MGEMRLQKFLARAGAASRRASEQLILDGRVTVNGQVANELGTKVNANDEVALDGRALALPDETVVIMLNKPSGYVTTMSDPQGRHTVAELVPVDEYPSLFPVGRLDQDTTGLLLFTNDGGLGNALLHPSRHVPKKYTAKVQGVPSEAELEKLRRGVLLEDGPTAPAKVRLINSDKLATVELTIKEGRKRQVKRMFDAIGHKVKALHRNAFAGIELGDLRPGEWRELGAEEVEALRSAHA